MRKCLEGQDSVRIFTLSGCRGNKKIKVMLQDLERRRLRILDAINNPRPMVQVGRDLYVKKLKEVNNLIENLKK
jgi:hypothetical protein